MDDQRCLAVINVDDDRQWQRRLEGILRDERNLGQVLVELVLAGGRLVPLQNEIGRRHDDDLPGVGVEGIFAWKQGVAPDAAAAARNEFAVTIALTRSVSAAFAGVGNDHADVADFDKCLADHLDRRKQPVDEIAAFNEHL